MINLKSHVPDVSALSVDTRIRLKENLTNWVKLCENMKNYSMEDLLNLLAMEYATNKRQDIVRRLAQRLGVLVKDRIKEEAEEIRRSLV